jgi:hypothetical protein
MNLAFAKANADRCVDQARSLLITDGYLAPVVISLTEDGNVVPTSLILEKQEDKERLPEILWELSLTANGLVVLIDSYVKETATDEMPTASLQSDPDASEAIVCMAFVKGASAMRRILYTRAEPKATPSFFDQGWTDFNGKDGATLGGRLANPFIN